VIRQHIVRRGLYNSEYVNHVLPMHIPPSHHLYIFEMDRLIVSSLAFFAIAANGLPQNQPPIDTADPNASDPTTVPDGDFALPDSRTAEPFVDGIPTLPDVCDPSNLTEDCFNALDNDEQGAYLWFENNHGQSLLSFVKFSRLKY